MFKTGFEYKITFWICELVLWIHKGYCVVKNIVWNVRIKSFMLIQLNATNVVILKFYAAYAHKIVMYWALRQNVAINVWSYQYCIKKFLIEISFILQDNIRKTNSWPFCFTNIVFTSNIRNNYDVISELLFLPRLYTPYIRSFCLPSS